MESLSTSSLSQTELNAAALDQFVYKRVDTNMIGYLAAAAYNVIQCDPTMMPPPATRSKLPTPPGTPPSKVDELVECCSVELGLAQAAC